MKWVMKTIRKHYQFDATVSEVLEALTSGDQITTWVGVGGIDGTQKGRKIFSLGGGQLWRQP